MPPNNIHESAMVEPPTPLQRPQEVLKRYEPDIKDIVDFVTKVRDRMPQDSRPDSSAQAAALQRLGDFVRNMEVLMKTLQGRPMGKGIPVNAEHLEAHIRANIFPLKQQIEAMRKAVTFPATRCSPSVTNSPSSVAEAAAGVSGSSATQPTASRRSKRIRLAKNSKYAKATDSSEDEAPTPPPLSNFSVDKNAPRRAADAAAPGAGKSTSRARSSRGSRGGGAKNAKGNGSYYADLVGATVTSKYMCTACNTMYRGESSFNPWWNIQPQKCPHCAVSQVPRIDILDPDNDYCRVAQARELFLERKRRKLEPEPEPIAVRIPEKRARCQVATKEEIPTCQPCSLDESQASRLLVLMQHARLCQGRHNEPRTREVCTSAKFMMLHLRDCPGVDSKKRPCPFSWCRMGTELLRHLRECNGGATCGVCHPTDLPKSLLELQYLNHYTEELMFSTDERPSSAPSEKSDTSKLDLSEFLSGDDFESEDGDPEDDGLYVGAEEVEDLANFPELQDFLFETA